MISVETLQRFSSGRLGKTPKVAHLAFLFCFASGCGSNSILGTSPTPTSTVTTLTGLALSSIAPAVVSLPLSGNINLVANGSGFTSESRLILNGEALATASRTTTQLTAILPRTAITKPGTFPVFVRYDTGSGALRGGLQRQSNELNLVVQSPLALMPPAIASVSPSTLSLPLAAYVTLSIVGSHFTANSILVFNGTPLPTTVQNATALTATLQASLVSQPGAFPLYVLNTPNDTAKSNTVNFVVQDPSPPPDFQLTASTANLSINQWNSDQSSIMVIPQNGFTGTVSLTVSGVPSNIAASIAPSVGGGSMLTLQAMDDLTPGVVTLTVTGSAAGNSGPLNHTVTIALSMAELPVVRDPNGYCDGNGNWIGARYDGSAELPRTCFRTNLTDTPSLGNITMVAAGGDLEAAINAAQCGDTVTLQAGASFSPRSGSWPAKGCDDQHWITIRTSAPDSALPPEHSRVNPSYAGILSLPGRPSFGGGSSNIMAQILETSPGSSIIPGDHYRFIGIEIVRAADNKWYNDLVHVQTDRVIFDRCWIHGDPIAETTHLVQVASGTDHLAIIDSYLNDAHCTAVTGVCLDSQAVSGNDGGSTIKIVNNFLEAAGENILFGGGTAHTLTTDLEIRLNHLFKPMIWNPAEPSFIGTKFIVKNNFEVKEGQRFLLEGNILENTWAGYTQRGTNILLTPKNQEGRGKKSLCPLCLVSDVTLRYSYITHGASALTIGYYANAVGAWSAGSYDYSIHDLIFDGMQYPTCYKCGIFLNAIGGGYDDLNPPPTNLYNLAIDHVTLVNVGFLDPKGGGFEEMDGPPPNNPTDSQQIQNVTWNNSIMATGANGAYPSGGGSNNCSVGQKTIADEFVACFAGNSSFTGNLLITDYATRKLVFPSGNQTSPTWDQVGFVNFNGAYGGDYHLSSASPYLGTATDGLNPGADVTAVMEPVTLIQSGGQAPGSGVIATSYTPLTISTSSLTTATEGAAYSVSLSASGGTPPYLWSMSSGNAPAWLSLTSSGLLSGTPVVSGSFPLVVTVSDASSPMQMSSKFFILQVTSSAGGAGIPQPAPAYFGFSESDTSPLTFPTVSYGMQRFWDSPPLQWPSINTAPGVFNFSNLDTMLAQDYTSGVMEGFYTLARTPPWATSQPADANCHYTTATSGGGNGECDAPADLNADGSGTNATWKAWITGIAGHVNDSGYLQTHAHIKYWEIWNEPDTSKFWSGTFAQLARLTEDANCIITGRGVIHQSGNGIATPCTATPIDVTAQIVMASAHAKSPALTYGQNELYCYNTAGIPAYQLPCPNPANAIASAVDIINFHMKPGNETGNTCPAPTPCTPESAMQMYITNIHNILQPTEQVKPLWNGEASYSDSGFTGAYADPDMASSFMARFYLINWSMGISGMAWYNWDDLRMAASEVQVAYQQSYDWIANATLNAPCSANGSAWSCTITTDGIERLILWDTAQSCSNGTCTTANHSVSAKWTQYQSMISLGTPSLIIDGWVPVGAKPIILR